MKLCVVLGDLFGEQTGWCGSEIHPTCKVWLPWHLFLYFQVFWKGLHD